jgi:hypothetical protein
MNTPYVPRVLTCLPIAMLCMLANAQSSTLNTQAKSQLINGTGISWSANYPRGNNQDCSIALLSMQSQNADQYAAGDYSSQAATNTGSIQSPDLLSQQDCKTKMAGAADFLFKKINAVGSVINEKSGEWDCVLDTRTNLMWEVKRDPRLHMSDPRAADETFTWYSGNANLNGGAVGEWNSQHAKCVGYTEGLPATYCNTDAFVQRINAKKLCGFSDWRLPTRVELESIVDYGRSAPAINTAFFPFVRSELYWTQSPYVEDNKSAWAINFCLGSSMWQVRNNPQRVMLVRTQKEH